MAVINGLAIIKITMEECLNWFNNNQWLNLIFLSLAMLSIVVSIYLYRKSRKRKKPVFDKRSINVISDTIQQIGEIDVTFKGSKIENLTVTKVAFWNDGNDTINDTDQAPTDTLKIAISEDYNILESEVIFQSNYTNNIKANISNNQIDISFDYLDPNQGGIIKFVHTGKKSSDIDLTGTFKGANKLKRVNSGLFNIGASIVLPLPMIGKLSNSNKEKRIIQKAFPWIVLLTGTEDEPEQALPDVSAWKRMVAKAILFKTAHKLIRPMFPAFQANVAAYAVSALSERIGDRLDLDKIWQNQSISGRLQEQIQIWAREVNDSLQQSANGRMISEWAKKAECWEAVLKGRLSDPLDDILELR